MCSGGDVENGREMMKGFEEEWAVVVPVVIKSLLKTNDIKTAARF